MPVSNAARSDLMWYYGSVANVDQTFEKWSELAKSASAQLADLYPVLQKLPDLIAPNVSYAKKLFTAERKNHVDHWIRAKKALDSGKSLVSLQVLHSVPRPQLPYELELIGFVRSPASATICTALKSRKVSPTMLQRTSAVHFWRQARTVLRRLCTASYRRWWFGLRSRKRLRRRLTV